MHALPPTTPETANQAEPKAPRLRATSWHHRYSDGEYYVPARGRYAPKKRVEDASVAHPWVFVLGKDRPHAAELVRKLVREMKIRFYQPRTIRAYARALASFLRWLNAAPHEATREDIKDYIEFLVDGGASVSWVGVNLAALRTTLDKMCGEDLTLGLQTPRRAGKLPVVLSPKEVVRLLQATPSLRDKLLLGLMYATGVRVGEAVRLRWRDIDFDRGSVKVWQGKGRKDRYVMLPESFRPILEQLHKIGAPDDPLFPSRDAGRYMSPRTAQRIMQRALAMAQITKRATCHSLRHTFATHLLENGTDIRFIQKLLGHVRLETTTLYTKVAALPRSAAVSPLDRLLMQPAQMPPSASSTPPASAELLKPPPQTRTPLLRLRFEVKPDARTDAAKPRSATASVQITNVQVPLKLEGLRLVEMRPGWVALEVPPIEAWEHAIRWLSPAQKERLAEPAFFRLLQEELTRRFVRLKTTQ
jgi:site-specific recombinase XerD